MTLIPKSNLKISFCLNFNVMVPLKIHWYKVWSLDPSEGLHGRFQIQFVLFGRTQAAHILKAWLNFWRKWQLWPLCKEVIVVRGAGWHNLKTGLMFETFHSFCPMRFFVENWHTKNQGHKKERSLFRSGRVHPCPSHTSNYVPLLGPFIWEWFVNFSTMIFHFDLIIVKNGL